MKKGCHAGRQGGQTAYPKPGPGPGTAYGWEMVVVGVLLVTLRMEGNSSLKEKRRVVKSLLGRVKARFNASASEVDGQDRHEMAVVGFSVMGSDTRVLNRVLDHLLNFVDETVDAEVVDSEIICPLFADEALADREP